MASDRSRSSDDPVIRGARDYGTTVVRLHVNTTSPPAALRPASVAVTADGAGALVDLSEATFIDASIVGVLAEARQRLGAAGAAGAHDLWGRVRGRVPAEGVIVGGRRWRRER